MRDNNQIMAEVGEGNLNWPEILKAIATGAAYGLPGVLGKSREYVDKQVALMQRIGLLRNFLPHRLSLRGERALAKEGASND